MNTQQAQVSPHDCKEYGVYRVTKEYESAVCFKCNYITEFRWKSILKRINSIFD
jgi:hypothetical protein